MMKQGFVAGIDIGGTKIHGALFAIGDKKLTHIASRKIATREITSGEKEHFIYKISDLISDLTGDNAECKVLGVGIGAPGPLDPKKGIIISPPNAISLHNIAIVHDLGGYLGIPVELANDADCAALGEAEMGAGAYYDNFVFFTLGTGIGSGIIINKKLERGQGRGGEFGHIPIVPTSFLDSWRRITLRCGCGMYGCLEAYIGTKNVSRLYALCKQVACPEHYPKDIREVTILAENGDETALRFFSQFARYLYLGIRNVILALDPEAVVLGGGATGASKFFFENLRKLQKEDKTCFGEMIRNVPLRKAQLGNDAGAFGAAYLILNRLIKNDEERREK